MAETGTRPTKDRAMKHHTTRSLYAYWTRLRGSRSAPERAEVSPGAVRELLGDMFILDVHDRERFSFRLAGTRLCAAFCGELKGRDLLDLMEGDDRDALHSLLWSVCDEAAACVLGCRGRNAAGQNLDFEMILLPLRHEGRTHSRILGSCAALDTPYWFGSEPIAHLSLTTLRVLWPEGKPSFLIAGETSVAPAPLAPRIGHLQIYEGGRA